MTQIEVGATAPFAVEVLVYEEDTWQMLSAGTRVQEMRESKRDLQHAVESQVACFQGDIIRRGSRWFAVIYDVDADMEDTEATVDLALTNLLLLIKQEEVASIGIQALGAFHRHQSPEHFITKLEQRRRAGQIPDCLQKVWVKVRDL